MNQVVDMHAFEDAWEVEPEALDLRGLIRMVELWLDARLERPVLVAGVENVASLLSEAWEETERDLQDHRFLHPRMLTPIEGQLRCYRELLASLEGLAAAVDARQPRVVRQRLDELRSGRSRLLSWCDASDTLRVELQCPRCGGPGPDRCADCGLEVLHPAPSHAYRPLEAEAFLGPEYEAVFRVWEQILDGDVTLSAILAPLERLERLLGEIRSAGARPEEVCGKWARIPEAIRGALEGVEQIRVSGDSRQVLDLLQGWERIFRSAVALQEIGESVPGGQSNLPPEVADRIALSSETW